MENPLGDFAENKRDWQAVGVASGLGCTVVVSLLLCIGGGVLLDRWLGTSPIFVLVGVALGLAAAGYSLYELAVLGMPDRGRIKVQPSKGQRRVGNGEGE
jgi:ATP synthase protein I